MSVWLFCDARGRDAQVHTPAPSWFTWHLTAMLIPAGYHRDEHYMTRAEHRSLILFRHRPKCLNTIDYQKCLVILYPILIPTGSISSTAMSQYAYSMLNVQRSKSAGDWLCQGFQEKHKVAMG